MELKYNKFKLSNGIRVVLVPRKETKAVFVNVMFGAGSRYENEENNGIAHFLEHMAFKGTKKRPTTLDISKEIDGVGGSWNAYTGEDITGYWIKLQAEKIELAIDILSDMLLNSKLEQKEIDKEKGTIVEEIKMHNDNPRSFAGIKFQELLYGDSPLGRNILGTEKTVHSIDRKKMIDFKNSLYNPDNTVIAIGGNINQSETKKLLEKYFGKLKGKTHKEFEKAAPAKNGVNIKFHKKDIQQASVIMGFHSFERGHKDRYIQDLIACVLGGYMSSKLFIEVREKKGLAYYVGTFVDSYKETGCFGIYGGFSPKKLEDALKSIFKILQDVKKNGFKPEEIKMAKENSIGKLILNLEAAGGWAAGIAESEIYELPIETPEDMIKGIRKVSNADIKIFAKKFFKKENFNMVVVGPDGSDKEIKYSNLVKL